MIALDRRSQRSEVVLIADHGEAVARRGPVNEGTEQEKYGDRWPGDRTKTGFPGGRFPRERFPRGTFRLSEGRFRKPAEWKDHACPSDIASCSSGFCGDFCGGSLEPEQHTGNHSGGRNLVGDHSGRWELIGGCLKGNDGRLGGDSGRPESGE